MGALSIRRRLEPSLQVDVYEVKLGDEHLMSSLFTVAERELAHLGLAAVTDADLDVAVGGLGLGYTARAVLEDPRVRSIDVVEALEPVIDWHERDLVPGARELVADERCHLVHGDFFSLIARAGPLRQHGPSRYHAVLVDIDHTPRHVLRPDHHRFYTPQGMREVANHLHPGGVFALWSDDRTPDEDFLAVLGTAFPRRDAHVVTFPNVHTGGDAANTVYVAAVG